jgi:hypothetical protein
MIKFAISAERFAQACSLTEYIGVLVGNVGSQMSALPKMLVDDKGAYIVTVTLDDEGDIKELQNVDKAQAMMTSISIPRFEKLRKEITQAARDIVNPTNGKDLIAP